MDVEGKWVTYVDEIDLLQHSVMSWYGKGNNNPGYDAIRCFKLSNGKYIIVFYEMKGCLNPDGGPLLAPHIVEAKWALCAQTFNRWKRDKGMKVR